MDIRPLSARWWLRDRDDRLVLAQPPNAALGVWLATLVLRWTGWAGQQREDALAGIGRGALIVWALDELVRGATPARRLLGALVLGVLLVGVFA